MNEIKSTPEYWAQCEKLCKEWGAKNMPPLPPQKHRNDDSLRSFILNIPYQHDLKWWFEEWQRREDAKADGWDELKKKVKFRDYVRREWHARILQDPGAGLFTGETSLHIAIQSKEPKFVEWILEKGATVHAKAQGVFFQPQHDDLRDEFRGTYYGSTPLGFAASVGEPKILDLLRKFAFDQIWEGLINGWTPPNDPKYKCESRVLG